MGLTKSKKIADGRERSKAVRSLTCGQVMTKPRLLIETASVAEALDKITINEWDHLFIINSERVPIGRVHAVDLLKLIAKKSVNREVAWMHSIPAGQLVTQETMTMREKTPLLKAAALMLSNDINQLAVVDSEGRIVGVVSHSTVARILPRFIL
tara:strand:- start:23 stop:484 length:462 start_codon:yes stop_codon:yes gene_type:complete